jgi:hypothetical protein
MYPQRVSITPVKRRLDYRAALGIVEESPSKNRPTQAGRRYFQPGRKPDIEVESIYTESGESEYTDDYTLEDDDDEYTDGSSYYDDSEDESYERALSVFSRRGNKQFTNEKRRTPYSIRDNLSRSVLQNKNIANQMN